MNTETLIKELKRRAEYHRTNQFDPHDISAGVMVALREVLGAVEAAVKTDAERIHELEAKIEKMENTPADFSAEGQHAVSRE